MSLKGLFVGGTSSDVGPLDKVQACSKYSIT